MAGERREKERTISYRIGRPYTDRLEEAAALNGMSRGQYARLVLVTHFEETAIHRLSEEVRELRKELTELRLDHAIRVRGDLQR